MMGEFSLGKVLVAKYSWSKHEVNAVGGTDAQRVNNNGR